MYFKVIREGCRFYSEGFKEQYDCEFEVWFDFIGAEEYGVKRAMAVFAAMHEVLLREKTDLYYSKLIKNFPLTPPRECILIDGCFRNNVRHFRLVISDFK